MALSEKEIDLIKAYVDGELTGEELLLFKEKLAESKEFSDYATNEAEAVSYLSSIRAQQVKEEIKQIYKHTKASKRVRASKPFYTTAYFKIAAALVVVALSFFSIRDVLKTSEEELFRTYYKPFPVISVRGNQTEAAYDAYKNENYEKAVEILESQVKEGDNFTEKIVLANCYINTDQFQQAKDLLMNITGNSAATSTIKSHAYWYQALLYLKQKDIDKAKSILKKLKSDALYQKKATELFNKLEYLE